MSDGQSRRSFLTDVLVRAAGGWLLLTGVGFSTSSCGGVSKYGGPPDDSADTGEPVEKYGGPPGEDASTVMKYGGPSRRGRWRPEVRRSSSWR